LEHSAPDNSLERLWQEITANATVIRPVEFPGMCAMGLALGKKVKPNSSVSTQVDRMTYYFSDEAAKATFLQDPQGNLAKARAYAAP
jgi:YHS domain-containing protein